MSHGLRSASVFSWNLLEGETAILPNPERGRGTKKIVLRPIGQ